jgi:uroporphyrinogen-III synthase
VFSANRDAKALTALIARSLQPSDGALLLPTGEGQGTALAEDLRRIGFDVMLEVAYRAIGVDVLPESAAANLREHLVEAAMFFSGETARHFVRLLQAADLNECVRGIEALSISEQAAAALRSLPWRRIKVAVKPNQEEMLVLLND